MIKIDNEFYVDSDNYQYIVCQKAINKKNKEVYFKPLAFYSKIEQCIEYIMRYKQRKLCQRDINFIEYINKCNEINAEMRRILSQIGMSEKIVSEDGL